MSASLICTTLCHKFLNLSLNNTFVPLRNRSFLVKPKLRYPKWQVKRERVLHEDHITADNKEFIQEFIQDRLTVAKTMLKLPSPLLDESLPHGEWTPKTKRVGLIARKIGAYPLWSTNGRKVHTTLLQVVDNHVVKYLPPGQWNPPRKPTTRIHGQWGCVLVGAETVDPSLLTKEYCGLFKNTGVQPKKHLCRFIVTPEAAIAPGTPLYASHFRIGDRIDVRGLTIDHGFQGVVKRWGFKGMPASHGVTKSHRRPGNIGGGGEKGRVWPGTKMPGHMGNRWRMLKGARILRINTKYNVIWVEGLGIAGHVNGLCYLYDTILPLRKPTTAPPFPTYIPDGNEEEDMFHESVRPFNLPTLTFSE